MRHSTPDQLIDAQQKILDFVNTYTADHDYAPSIREICKSTNISSTSHVAYHLKRLQEWGFLNRMPHTPRTIRLKGPAQPSMHRLPILGRIRAGVPVPLPDSDLPHYDWESYLDISTSMLPKNTGSLFALEVEGDSMIDAMINDGDLVVLRKVSQVPNGTMVAVWLKAEGETTLKYYFFENGQVRLQPANRAYQPMFYPAENVEIQGEVVHISRVIKRMM